MLNVDTGMGMDWAILHVASAAIEHATHVALVATPAHLLSAGADANTTTVRLGGTASKHGMTCAGERRMDCDVMSPVDLGSGSLPDTRYVVGGLLYMNRPL